MNNPIVKGQYQTADNPIFEVFYLADAHAVIAVGRSAEGAVSETFQSFGGGEHLEIWALHPELFGKKRRPAQSLEGLQSETLSLVLHEDVLDAEFTGEHGQVR